MQRTVSIGGPAFFLAVGLVLLLAVPDTVVAGIELSTVGLIISVISGAVLLFGIFQSTRSTKSAVRSVADPSTGETITERQSNL